MTALMALWLPIVLSAVFVFIASWIIHMTPGWHSGDYPPVPNEEALRAAVGPLGLPPGDYMVPRAMTMKEMQTPEFEAKLKQGPVLILTVGKNEVFAMGPMLALWFVYCLIVSVFAAYVAGRALGPGAPYLQVFRFAGTSAFFCYAVGLWQMSIWYKRKWSVTIRYTIDGLIYALLTAGTFGWLWPR